MSPRTQATLSFFFILNLADTRGPHVILSYEDDWWTPLTADPADLAVDPLTVDLVNIDQVNADVMMTLAPADPMLTSC